MHKDLKDLDQSKRSETKMSAIGRDERLDPSTRVLMVLARISERSCQTLFICSITTKTEMTSYPLNCSEQEQDFYFFIHRFVILFFDDVILIMGDWLKR